MVETMMKGTIKRDAKEIANRIDELGAIFVPDVSKEYFGWSIEVLNGNFENIIEDFTNIERISFVFDENELINNETFYENNNFFTNSDLDENDINKLSHSFKILINAVNKLNIKNIDFLVCNSLKYSQWSKFFDKLSKLTKVNVGASSKKIGPKFLRITDIDLTGSKIKWADVPYCKISDKDYLKYKLIDEDILFTRIGATTGKTCIVKSPPESVFASYLIRFKVDLEKALPFFIYHFTTNKGYWNQINASKEGKLKKGVSSSQLKIFQIPLPALPTQQKIASILSAIDAKIEAEENKKKALEELFKSLLHNLMTAKIRVNQLEVPS